MQISFRNGSGQNCQVRIAFSTLVDAVHHLKTLIEKYGNDAFTATFHPEDTMKITIVPFFGGNGVSFEALFYSELEFRTFCECVDCQKSFQLFFGFPDNDSFMAVSVSEKTFLQVNGYTVV
jgi:hypothetical protein